MSYKHAVTHIKPNMKKLSAYRHLESSLFTICHPKFNWFLGVLQLALSNA